MVAWNDIFFGAATRPLRVLVVDDNSDDYLQITRFLSKIKKARFEVQWIKEYDPAIQAMQRNEHDAYLLDYYLGTRNGLQLLRQAIAQGCEGPIIFLTGIENSEVDLEAMKAGAADYLVKGHLDPESLERSIRYAIQHSRTVKELRDREEQFRLLFEKSLDPILIWGEDGHCLEANHAARALLDVPNDGKLHDLCIYDLFKREGKNAPERIEAYLKQGQASGEFVFAHGRNLRVAEFSACRFAHNRHLSILHDVTQSRLLEKKLLEISESDLNDAKGEAV